MSNYSADPPADRTVQLDQYSGKIPADVQFADYSFYGKSMGVGIALHDGDMGWQNIVLNTLFCLSVIFVSLSGAVTHLLRRPSKAGWLAAPPLPGELPLWKGAVLVGLAVSLAFPMAGLTLLAVLALDVLVLARLPVMRRILS